MRSDLENIPWMHPAAGCILSIAITSGLTCLSGDCAALLLRNGLSVFACISPRNFFRLNISAKRLIAGVASWAKLEAAYFECRMSICWKCATQ